MPDVSNDKRIRVITGHFGSGKTEFALNYARLVTKHAERTAIADLDVINTYFRSREQTARLAAEGIELLSGNQAISSIDVPAISADVLKPLEDRRYALIMDIGGNPDGAKVLGQFRKQILAQGCDHFFVINRNRPETQTVEQVEDFLRRTEAFTQIPVTGLINSTHMLKATTIEDVMYGQELCEAVSKQTTLPLRYISVWDKIAPELPEELQPIVLPLELSLRESWML